jgi:hypothetical protein
MTIDIWIERPLWILIAVVLVVGAVFAPAEIYPGDPMTMREEARSILERGELAISDAVARNYDETSEVGQFVVTNPRNGRSYSKFGSMSGWFFVVPLAAEKLAHGTLPPFTSESRLFYLNVFNLALSVLIAASLYRTARRFEADPRAAATFVGICFYTTFLWNYLRAQNSEIMQLLLFAWTVTAFLNLCEARCDSNKRVAIYLFWAAYAALLLTKASYLFIGPLFLAAIVCREWFAGRPSALAALMSELKDHAIPAICAVAVWGIVNTIKFGAPWLTGYHVWKPELHSMGGFLVEALAGLAFSVQFGFLFCFPVLALALPFVWKWLRARPVEYGAICLVAASYVLLLGSMPVWRGEWCYGPRYWLFVLPFLSLPAVDGLAWLRRRSLVAGLAAMCLVFVLSYSAWLQIQVHRFPFFAYYALRLPLESIIPMHAPSDFEWQSYGRILHDAYAYQGNWSELGWWQQVKPHMTQSNAQAFENHVQSVLAQSNLLFFR